MIASTAGISLLTVLIIVAIICGIVFIVRR